MIDANSGRNIRCPQYGKCLDGAIERNLAGFDCLGCSHRYDEDRIDTTELIGCVRLLWAVFMPAVIDDSYVTNDFTGRPLVDSGKRLRESPFTTASRTRHDRTPNADESGTAWNNIQAIGARRGLLLGARRVSFFLTPWAY